MKKVFNEFTIALLLLTAITGVMFISCSDDEDDKRYSQNTETSIPNWEDSTVTEYNYKTMPLNYYLAGIWDEVDKDYVYNSAIALSTTGIWSSMCGREVNWKYSLKDDNCICVCGSVFIYVTRLSENEMIFSEWIPCEYTLVSTDDIKYIRVRNKMIKY